MPLQFALGKYPAMVGWSFNFDQSARAQNRRDVPREAVRRRQVDVSGSFRRLAMPAGLIS
jgi:hypothetical protein